jgi:hypothetical protein
VGKNSRIGPRENDQASAGTPLSAPVPQVVTGSRPIEQPALDRDQRRCRAGGAVGLGDERGGAGAHPEASRRSVRSRRCPFRRSSSRMRRWPQARFSRLSVTMSSTMVSSSGGRPPLSVCRRSDRKSYRPAYDRCPRRRPEVALEGLIAAREQVREHLRRPDPEGDVLFSAAITSPAFSWPAKRASGTVGIK